MANGNDHSNDGFEVSDYESQSTSSLNAQRGPGPQEKSLLGRFFNWFSGEPPPPNQQLQQIAQSGGGHRFPVDNNPPRDVIPREMVGVARDVTNSPYYNKDLRREGVVQTGEAAGGVGNNWENADWRWHKGKDEQHLYDEITPDGQGVKFRYVADKGSGWKGIYSFWQRGADGNPESPIMIKANSQDGGLSLSKNVSPDKMVTMIMPDGTEAAVSEKKAAELVLGNLSRFKEASEVTGHRDILNANCSAVEVGTETGQDGRKRAVITSHATIFGGNGSEHGTKDGEHATENRERRTKDGERRTENGGRRDRVDGRSRGREPQRGAGQAGGSGGRLAGSSTLGVETWPWPYGGEDDVQIPYRPRSSSEGAQRSRGGNKVPEKHAPASGGSEKPSSKPPEPTRPSPAEAPVVPVKPATPDAAKPDSGGASGGREATPAAATPPAEKPKSWEEMSQQEKDNAKLKELLTKNYTSPDWKMTEAELANDFHNSQEYPSSWTWEQLISNDPEVKKDREKRMEQLKRNIGYGHEDRPEYVKHRLYMNALRGLYATPMPGVQKETMHLVMPYLDDKTKNMLKNHNPPVSADEIANMTSNEQKLFNMGREWFDSKEGQKLKTTNPERYEQLRNLTEDQQTYYWYNYENIAQKNKVEYDRWDWWVPGRYWTKSYQILKSKYDEWMRTKSEAEIWGGREADSKEVLDMMREHLKNRQPASAGF